MKKIYHKNGTNKSADILSRNETTAVIEQVLSGNHNEFVKIVNLFKNKVFRYILKNINDYDAAEDLTQETFISVFTNLVSFKNNSSLSTWIMAIAVNKVRNYINRTLPKSKQNVSDDILTDYSSGESTPQQLAESREMEAVIENTIALLGDEYRQIYILIVMEDMSYNDVSEIMGIPVGTVKSRMHKVRKILTDKLQKFEKQLA